MSVSHPESVSFSDLSRNPRKVAEHASRSGRLRITHRDSPDFFLTAADREEERDKNLGTASRMFLALMKHDASARALMLAMPDVFPWVRHLREPEVRAFTVELVAALSDAAELALEGSAQEVIRAWQATARIKADPELYREAREETGGDFGRVEVIE